MVSHPLTTSGTFQFRKDWQAAQAAAGAPEAAVSVAGGAR
jgi:hypothetical protein